ncbi:hypothetical protein K456DRAFT_59429 [Colletotrichum gloeosporioides 23]|nr:hypothetical protein K456DRAFT_59429 [Colletotrichum gloeosporioides 23]
MRLLKAVSTNSIKSRSLAAAGVVLGTTSSAESAFAFKGPAYDREQALTTKSSRATYQARTRQYTTTIASTSNGSRAFTRSTTTATKRTSAQH